MKRRFRLTNLKDFQRVRRQGKSFAHPLLVLVVLPNEIAQPRIGVVAGRSVGGAVQRNRAKRRLREAVFPLLPSIQPGWDLVIIARQPALQVQFEQLRGALLALLKRAGVLIDVHGNRIISPSTSG